MAKIAYSGGLSVNLDEVKCIKQIGELFVIEMKRRYEYILNPFTEEYEKQEINDKVEMECNSYERARDYKRDFDEMWETYLNEKEKK